MFATAIAKYFRNATREAILLEVCDAGIVFLPGAGGTVQEVFQDACENYYADESSVAPMVLVGRRTGPRTLPAWPLLQALARGRAMEQHVHLVDTVEEAVDTSVRPQRGPASRSAGAVRRIDARGSGSTSSVVDRLPRAVPDAARAARPIRRRSTGRARSRSTWATELVGRRRAGRGSPRRVSSTTSIGPPARGATTGTPEASASWADWQ